MLNNSVPPAKKFATKSVIRRNEGGRAMESIRELVDPLGINTSYCNAVEHTLLALAGIEERPSKHCSYYDPILHGEAQLGRLGALEKERVEFNSIFFKIPLVRADSMELLQQFATANKLECNDYTDALSENDKEFNIKLIRIPATSAKDTLFPMIATYLKDHPEEVKRHTEVMQEELKARYPNWTMPCPSEAPNKQETPALAEPHNASKSPEASGSYSWGRFFALAALTTTAAAAAITLTNR
jgi:hypothetical protein